MIPGAVAVTKVSEGKPSRVFGESAQNPDTK